MPTLPIAPSLIKKLDLAVDDYSFDFTPALAAGDSIASSPTNPLVRSGDVVAVKRSLVGNVLAIRLSGGTVGVVSEVVLQATSTNGESPAFSLMVQVVS